jgi:ribosomal protein S6--L-glutamate ligase
LSKLIFYKILAIRVPLGDSMKIAILSRDSNLYSTYRLIQAAKKRGHIVEIIDVLKCYMNITTKRPTVHYKERELKGFDAIIPRIGYTVTHYGTAVLRQFESAGIYTINGSQAITRSRDKLRAHQILSKKGVAMPITAYAHSTQMTDDLIRICGGPPLVVKLIAGTQGKGVILAENYKMAKSVIEAFRALNAHFLVQEFIKEAAGSDIRCFVVGEKVVASMLRKSKNGDFRANLHSGGIGFPIKITKAERNMALNAAHAMGLKMAGIDIVRSDHGPKLLEINSSPGLEGIERVSKVDVAGEIIKHLEKSFRKGRMCITHEKG